MPVIQNARCPILIFHATNDWDIPWTHSSSLFDALLDPLMRTPLPTPPVVGKLTPETPAQVQAMHVAHQARAAERKEIVKEETIEGFGHCQEFTRRDGDGAHEVVWVKTEKGGHNEIALLDNVVKEVGRRMKISPVA